MVLTIKSRTSIKGPNDSRISVIKLRSLLEVVSKGNKCEFIYSPIFFHAYKNRARYLAQTELRIKFDWNLGNIQIGDIRVTESAIMQRLEYSFVQIHIFIP